MQFFTFQNFSFFIRQKLVKIQLLTKFHKDRTMFDDSMAYSILNNREQLKKLENNRKNGNLDFFGSLICSNDKNHQSTALVQIS